MSQRELEDEISRATGESRRTIRRRGFSIVDPSEDDFDPEPNILPFQMVDWDQADQQRRAA